MNKIEMGKKYKTRSGLSVRVMCTDSKHVTYPVCCLRTDDDGTEYPASYTAYGTFYVSAEHDYDLIEVSPWDDFKVDEPVMVRSKGDWLRRHFAGVQNGKPASWSGGATNWTNHDGDWLVWDECRRPTEEELKGKHSGLFYGALAKNELVVII